MAFWLEKDWQARTGRRIEAAVLYTQTPLLIAIPGDLLEAHKPAFLPAEESFGG